MFFLSQCIRGRLRGTVAAFAVCSSCMLPDASAVSAEPAMPLDLSVHYYTKVLSAEGVTRESNYDETMLRRPGHVWVARVLPSTTSSQDARQEGKPGTRKKISLPSLQSDNSKSEHKHFNHVVLPRHVTSNDKTLHVEFIDFKEKEIISIAPTEYENVNFDGSWANAYYLVDPKRIDSIPVSSRKSPIASAVWHESDDNGVFQRILWDGRRMVPLVVESGNRAGTFYQRIEIKLRQEAVRILPWENLKGFAQKEYADFLD